MSYPFFGEIRMFGYSFTPAGWAFCQGQLASIAQNQALFAVITTAFGGDGRTTMGLPDLRSRTPLHAGQVSGQYYPFSHPGGQEYVSLSTTQMPSHNHQLVAAGAAGTSPEPANLLFAYQAGDFQPDYKQDPYLPLTAMAPSMLTGAGKGLPHENRQPFLALRFCIALDGVFPTRN
ncbi:phage tail protein [Hahella sp. HN01]|uniref:phage tail protein n=1 Tax=Hahella sp. HN01 TaxID=2847262 RepID=UPI001C1EF051|nr:tail fiber protein [Hahella sp. HN01]MBU6952766.1 tail fiber protein [Hahella sp. HN01]